MSYSVSTDAGTVTISEDTIIDGENVMIAEDGSLWVSSGEGVATAYLADTAQVAVGTEDGTVYVPNAEGESYTPAAEPESDDDVFAALEAEVAAEKEAAEKSEYDEMTKEQLYEMLSERGLKGHSQDTKAEMIEALQADDEGPVAA